MFKKEPWSGNTVEEHRDEQCIAQFVAASEAEMAEYLYNYIRRYSPAQYATTFVEKPYEKDGTWYAKTRRYSKA